MSANDMTKPGGMGCEWTSNLGAQLMACGVGADTTDREPEWRGWRYFSPSLKAVKYRNHPFIFHQAAGRGHCTLMWGLYAGWNKTASSREKQRCLAGGDAAGAVAKVFAGQRWSN